MSRTPRPIRSDIAWSTAERIVVHGKDLPNELLGHINLGDMAFLELTRRTPSAGESIVFNAMLVALVEHGMTPSALCARLTYAGAPESLQAAVAAGLCGVGSVFVGSMEAAASMLMERLPADQAAAADDAALDAVAGSIVALFRERRAIIPGVGHPFHKPVDPRAPRLFELAQHNGLSGPYVRLLEKISTTATRLSGKPLMINATGAIAALCCELKLPPRIVRGLGIMARAVGLVGHLLEESETPIATEIWARADEETAAHLRPNP